MHNDFFQLGIIRNLDIHVKQIYIGNCHVGIFIS
jgi:hypothetical protein